jgi:hypothetical protein
MTRFAPYTLTITPGGRVTQQTGSIGDLGIGSAIIAGLALGLVLGAAPGALIAHYGFGVTWGKSILIGLGVMIGVGAIERAMYVPPAPAAPALPTTT